MHIYKTSLSVLLAMALGSAACAGNDGPAASIEEAHRAYYLGQYERSLEIYERLAAGGHAEAAERAGFMLLQPAGASARGGKPDTTRARARLHQAAVAGRPGATFMLGMMDNAD